MKEEEGRDREGLQVQLQFSTLRRQVIQASFEQSLYLPSFLVSIKDRLFPFASDLQSLPFCCFLLTSLKELLQPFSIKLASGVRGPNTEMGTMPQGALRALQTTLRLTIGGVLLLGSVVHTSVLVLVVHKNLKFQQLGPSTWTSINLDVPQRRKFVYVWKSFAFLSLRYKS